MVCVKCGKELLETRCENCRYEHRTEPVVLLSTPEETELIISWDAVDFDWLQAMVYQKEQEVLRLRGILQKRIAEDKTGKLKLWSQQPPAKTGNESPNSVGMGSKPAAPVRTPSGRRPRKPRQKISNIPQYKAQLEAYYLEQYPRETDRKPLSRAKVLDFIYKHRYDKVGLTSEEVEVDLLEVYRTYQVAGTGATGRPVAPASIKSFRDYNEVLTGLYIQNGRQMLSEEQIQQFLADYDLESRFGIRNWHVKVDLRRISEENP